MVSSQFKSSPRHRSAPSNTIDLYANGDRLMRGNHSPDHIYSTLCQASGHRYNTQQVRVQPDQVRGLIGDVP